MKLIVGLGNPGRQYARHRHNVGFKAIDRLADHHGIRGEKRKFHSIMAQGDILGTPCVLLRPTTYMNRSGMAVCAALHYYTLDPDDSLVVVDDAASHVGTTMRITVNNSLQTTAGRMIFASPSDS